MIFGFWLVFEERTIFPLENVDCSILDEFVPAADIHREEKHGFTLWCRKTKSDAIEVDELDIQGGRPEGGSAWGRAVD
jgi:hypothetical protein